MLPDNFSHEVGQYRPNRPSRPSQQQYRFSDSPILFIFMLLFAVACVVVPIWDDRTPGRVLVIVLGIFIYKVFSSKT